MLSCREASRLISEGLDRKLRPGERVVLRFHVIICDACHRVEKQLKLLRRAMSEFTDRHDPPGPRSH